MSQLFYVIGASGAGKDSIMNFVRMKLKGKRSILFSHRYITRLPDAHTENHIYLSPHEFKARLKAGLFAMDWKSHENYYGIGKEINYWMHQGFTVIVNGSREYLPEAQEKYKKLRPILIETSPDVLLKRLQDRGRENTKEIMERIERNSRLSIDAENMVRILNDGPIEEAGREFHDIISGIRKIKPLVGVTSL